MCSRHDSQGGSEVDEGAKAGANPVVTGRDASPFFPTLDTALGEIPPFVHLDVAGMGVLRSCFEGMTANAPPLFNSKSNALLSIALSAIRASASMFSISGSMPILPCH